MTKDVGARRTVIGIPARTVPVDVLHYSPGFTPYGAHCGEDLDPVPAHFSNLEDKLDELCKEVKILATARQPQPRAKRA